MFHFSPEKSAQMRRSGIRRFSISLPISEASARNGMVKRRSADRPSIWPPPWISAPLSAAASRAASLDRAHGSYRCPLRSSKSVRRRSMPQCTKGQANATVKFIFETHQTKKLSQESQICPQNGLTVQDMRGNLLRHPKRRVPGRGRKVLRRGGSEGSGNLENDTEKRSEQRQLILRENREAVLVLEGPG